MLCLLGLNLAIALLGAYHWLLTTLMLHALGWGAGGESIYVFDEGTFF